MELAVAVKPEGQADPGPIYENLYAWTLKQGYVVTDGPMEIFLTNVMTGHYAQMKTEVMVPIKKLPKQKD